MCLRKMRCTMSLFHLTFVVVIYIFMGFLTVPITRAYFALSNKVEYSETATRWGSAILTVCFWPLIYVLYGLAFMHLGTRHK